LNNQKKKNNIPPAGGTDNTPVQIPLTELVRIRRNKVRELQKSGINPYPYRFVRTHHIDELIAESETVVRLAGRVMLKRKMGKSFFADVRDNLERIQIYLKLDLVGQEAFDLFNGVDLGDIVGCEGTLFVTRMGERTLKVTSLTLLTKALHPLPDKRVTAGATPI
jgi:lysyl-tRNA synthetase class 2